MSNGSDAAALRAIRREAARVRAWLAEPGVGTGVRYASAPARINGVDGLGFAVVVNGGDVDWKGVFSTTVRDGVRLFTAASSADLIYAGVVYHGEEPVQERLPVVVTRVEARGRSVFVRFHGEARAD